VVEEPHADPGTTLHPVVLPRLPQRVQAHGGLRMTPPLRAPHRVADVGHLTLVELAEVLVHELGHIGVDPLLLHAGNLVAHSGLTSSMSPISSGGMGVATMVAGWPITSSMRVLRVGSLSSIDRRTAASYSDSHHGTVRTSTAG